MLFPLELPKETFNRILYKQNPTDHNFNVTSRTPNSSASRDYTENYYFNAEMLRLSKYVLKIIVLIVSDYYIESHDYKKLKII